MTEGRRLFIALWPDQAIQQAIVDAAATVAGDRKIAGRRILPERVHLTLLFLGDVEATAEARLCEAVAGIRTPAFKLVLDQAGCFYRSRVLWVGPQNIPAGMMELWESLRAAAEASGVAQDYKPLVPHVTCLRDLKDRIRPVPVEPIRWPVTHFALVHSELGSQPRPASLTETIGRRHLGMARQYHVVSQWPLQTVPAQSVKTVQPRRGTE